MEKLYGKVIFERFLSLTEFQINLKTNLDIATVRSNGMVFDPNLFPLQIFLLKNKGEATP